MKNWRQFVKYTTVHANMCFICWLCTSGNWGTSYTKRRRQKSKLFEWAINLLTHPRLKMNMVDTAMVVTVILCGNSDDNSNIKFPFVTPPLRQSHSLLTPLLDMEVGCRGTWRTGSADLKPKQSEHPRACPTCNPATSPACQKNPNGYLGRLQMKFNQPTSSK